MSSRIVQNSICPYYVQTDVEYVYSVKKKWDCTFFFVALPLLLANLLLLSMEAALRRGDFPFFPPSGFSIHQELFPVPSFCMRTKRLCRERLCLMEFWIGQKVNHL